METGDSATTAGAAPAGSALPENPYGGKPGSGLQFPPYYKPTPSVRSRNNYFPSSETIGPKG
jgi:ribonuclease Z